jgi:hypothetical protein
MLAWGQAAGRGARLWPKDPAAVAGAGPATEKTGTMGGREMASRVEAGQGAGDRARPGLWRTLAGGAARALPDHAPRGPVCRALLAVITLAGAAWFAAAAVHAAGTALGRAPARDVATAVAAIIVAPAALGFAVPLLDACLVLVLGRVAPETWSRIMAESLGALILACCVTVIAPGLWPGIGVLGLVAVLGTLFGLRRWQPRVVAAEGPARLPLVLLLFDEPRSGARPTVAVSQAATSEREAA